LIAVVKHEELLNFLVKNNVRRMLIDAPFPSRAETLIEVSKAGIEIYFIRRTTIIETFKKYLRKKLEIEVPRKNDFTDTVLQAFIKPKYLQQIDWKYIDCLLEMHLWRDNAINYQKYRQRLKTYPPKKRGKVAKLIADIEKTAQDFVDTVVTHYPNVEEHFKRFGITDVITQAYYCEVYLEMKTCRKFNGVLKKAGIDVSQKAHLKKWEQRKQKKEQRDGEEQNKDAKEKKFIYDGKFSNALNQLTLKVRRLNLYNKKDKLRITVETIRLAKEIWLMLEEERKTERRRPGGGGLGLDEPGPLFSRGLASALPHLAGGPAKAGKADDHPAPVQGPRHPAVLTTTPATSNPPLFPSHAYRFTASMGSILSFKNPLIKPFLEPPVEALPQVDGKPFNASNIISKTIMPAAASCWKANWGLLIQL